MSDEQEALWPLQRWMRANATAIIEPHLNHFKDTLSVLSQIITKHKDRIDDLEDRVKALERVKK